MLQSQDLLSSSFRIVGLIFLNSKITRSQCYRHLLLVLIGITLRRRLRVFKIVALVLGLQVIIKLNQERNSVQWTQYWFSYFIVIKVQRFLWSIMILNSCLVLYSLGRHFFNTFIIVKSSLLYILQLYLGAECLVEKNITSLSLLFLLVQ